VKRPNVNYWFVWKQFLTKVYCIHEGNLTLKQPLGEWEQPPSNTWEWYYDPITSFLYSIQIQKVMIYERIYTRGDSTRTGGLWFGNPTIKRRREFTQSTKWFWRATVGEISRGRAKVRCDGWYKHKYAPVNPNQLPISNVHQILQAQQVPQWMFKHGNTHTISIPTLKQMFSQPLRLVTDASYEDGAGSTCVIIETWDEKQRMILVGDTPSNTTSYLGYNDSYRSELYGILIGMHAVKAIEIHLDQSAIIDISCDNDRALDMTERFRYVTAKAQHFDVCKSLVYIRKQLRSSLSFIPVEGHVKEKYNRKLTRNEELNDSCDKIAKASRCKKIPAVILEGEGLSVWKDGSKLYSDIETNIRKVYEDAQAERVVREKYQWDRQTFYKINWNALEKATKILPRPSTIRMAKYTTNTLPVGMIMELRNQWNEAYCPRCKCPNETPIHVIRCPSRPSRTLMKDSIEKINKWMIDMRTEERMREQIIICTTSWIAQEEPVLEDCLQPIKNQLELGWDHFMAGRIHVSLQTHMEAHYKNTRSRKTGLTWATNLIVNVWNEIFEKQWKLRNKCVHRINAESKCSRENENLQSTITTLRAQETPTSLLWKDRQLMEEPLQQLMRRPVAQKKGWIHSFRIAQKTRNSSQSREEIGMTDVMSRFLQTRRQHKKKRISKRRVGGRNGRKKLRLKCVRRTQIKKKVGSNHRKKLTSVFERNPKRKRVTSTGDYSRGVKKKKEKRNLLK